MGNKLRRTASYTMQCAYPTSLLKGEQAVTSNADASDAHENEASANEVNGVAKQIQ